MNSHKLRLTKPFGQVLNWFLSAAIALSAFNATAQCTNVSAYGTVTLTTTANSSGMVSCSYAGEYGTWNGVTSGYGYTTSSSISGDYITVRSGSSSGTVVAHGLAPLTWFAQTTATHYVHVNTNSACGTQNTCRDITTTVLGTGCANTSAYGSATLSSSVTSGTIGGQWAGEYGTWNGIVSGNNYTTSSTVSTDFLTIRSGSASGPIVAFGTTPLTWNALTSGTHYIHVNTSSGCGTQNTSRSITTAFNAQCPAPNNLASFNISTTSFTLAFNETGNATSWQLSLDSNGTFQSYFTVTNDTITGTGFLPGTVYTWKVRAICGAGDTSAWSTTNTFNTLCNAYTIPYFEGFESGYSQSVAVGGCLSQSSTTGTSVWTANTSLTTYNRTPYAGSWNAFLQYGNTDWIYIPVSLTSGTSYTVEFYARQDGATAANSNVMAAFGSNSNAAAMTDTIIAPTGIINGNYQQFTGTFTPTSTGVFYVGIRGFMNGSPWYISLDNMAIFPTPNCPAPSSLAAASITASGASLSWTENGTATSWQIEYDTAGFTQGTGMTTVVTSNPTSISGLTFETNYNFYVRAICGTGDTSAWSGGGSFYTGYCNPNPSSVDGSGITNVSMNTLSNSTGVEPGNYGNYSSMVAVAAQGTSLAIDITLATGYTYDMWAWVDWNDDLDFSDPGEEYFLGTSAITNPIVFSSSIAIPSSATLGNHRIRIGGADAGLGTTSPSNPCYTGAWGSFEDYTLNIYSPPTDDAGIAAINSLSFPSCVLDSTICVTVQNLGTDTLFSCDIKYAVNNGVYTTYNWTGVIPPQSDDTVCSQIGTATFDIGDNLTVLATNANGTSGSTYTANDTLMVNNMNVSLHGVYNIPGDFSSISGAVDTLNAFGTCDTVWFEIATGTYNESVVINQFLRVSPTAPVIFKSVTGDSADVLWADSTALKTIVLNGADYVWFEDLTIKNAATSGQNVISLSAGADYNKLERCHLIGNTLNSTSNLYAVIYNQIGSINNYNSYVNNTIENGSYGIYNPGTSTALLESGTSIINNNIINPYYMGIYLRYQTGVEVTENRISSNSIYTNGYGVYTYYCLGGLDVSYNHIYPEAGSTWPYYGLYLYYSDGTTQSPGIISNNIVSATNGYACYQNYSDSLIVANNTFTVLGGTSTTSRAYYSVYSNNFYAYNNLISNFGAGQAAAYLYGTPLSIENNSYYSTGTNKFYVNGSYQTSYAAFQSAFALDTNSLYMNPDFNDTIAGISCKDSLIGAGVYLAEVTDDFTHQSRSNPPTIGAREMQLLSSFTLGPDATICDDHALLTAASTGGTVQWVDINGVSLGTGDSLMVNTNTSFPVIATYSNSCGSVSDSITITFIPNVELSAQVSFCAGDTVTLTPTAGLSSTAQYSWFPGNANTSQIGVSTPGYYILTKSESGCVSQDTIQAVEYAPILITIDSVENVACNGGSTGAIYTSVVGGTAPYAYVWNTGTTVSSAVGLSSGSYIVTVTDANGCTQTQSVSIVQPLAPLSSAALVTSNVLCYGNNDGSATVSATGGTSPYSYSWSNGSTSTSISSLTAGSYTVTVTDANGCTQTQSVSITQPAASLTAIISITSAVSCNGGNDGGALVSATGGTAPYSYSWSNGSTSTSISSLTAGSYTVTVTDANGCTQTQSVSITQPAASLTAIISITSAVSCNGGNDGGALVSAAGGTAPYSYLWSNGSVTSSTGGVTSGNYDVTVTDANGCTSIAATTIPSASGLVVNPVVNNSVSCFGGSDGGISALVSGGTFPYAYSWSNGSNLSSVSGLSSGVYTVTITDANGCATSTNDTITEPTQLGISVLSIDSANCYGASDGSIEVSSTGGVLPYAYSWNNSTSNALNTGLSAGVYAVTVTDANGCDTSLSASVAQPDSISIAITGTDLLCNNDNSGSAVATVSGGTGALNYLWSNNATTTSITALASGSYMLTVTDANGCINSSMQVITEPTQLGVSVLSIDSANCYGASDGSIEVSSTGGVLPYAYSWNNSTSNALNTGLSAGVYAVTVTDANGCDTSLSASVAQPDSISIAITGTDLLCNNDNSGSAAATASGGTGTLNYLWSNNATTTSIAALASGSYMLTVTDANGCINSSMQVITEPTQLGVSVLSIDSANCYGASDGSIEVSSTGGVLPYAYSWNNSTSNALNTGLSAGVYAVTVTDANGCDTSLSASVAQPDSISIAITGTDLLCNNDNSGSAAATASGGTGTLNYLWSNNATTTSIAALASGSYMLTVTDANGCVNSSMQVIAEPDVLSLGLTSTDVICSYDMDGEIASNVGGGVLPYSYNWNIGETNAIASGLAVGTYAVTITDANGCVIIDSASVTNTSTSIEISMPAEAALCLPFSITLESGVEAESYAWSTGESTASIDVTAGGLYTVTIGNTEGCLSTDSTTVIEQPCVGIAEDESSIAIDLYPNPNRGAFTLNIDNASSDQLSYRFMSLDGKLVQDGKLVLSNGNGTKEFQFTQLSSGMYFMSITTNQKVIIKRVIIH